MQEKIQKYINQDINNPTYLFHGSPLLLEKIIPKQSNDSNDDSNNIANAVFLFPSLIKASAYAFKDTIKQNSEGLNWNFQITNKDEYPIMMMENVNIDKDIEGYIYVFHNEENIKKDEDSFQYKSFDELIPIYILKIKYKDFEVFYEVKNNNKLL